MLWQPPEQPQSSVQGRFALKHLQRPLEQPFLHPHLSNSLQALEASGSTVQRGVHVSFSIFQPNSDGDGITCCSSRDVQMLAWQRMVQQGILTNKEKSFDTYHLQHPSVMLTKSVSLFILTTYILCWYSQRKISLGWSNVQLA